MCKNHIAALLCFAVSFFVPPLVITQTLKDTITKENQVGQDCSLTVDLDDRGTWITFTVNIPKDDKRLERLFSTFFVLGTNGSPWPWRVRVPINVLETEFGSKTFAVSVQKNQLRDSFIEFTCKWPDLKLSSLDGCYLILESYFDSKGKN